VSRIDRIAGSALPLRGDSIDTDRIIPARFLRAITFSGLEAHLFEDDRRQMDERAAAGGGPVHPFSNPIYRDASILLVNGNFGCGSSREHAPQALNRRGIRAVLGESFSEIFFANALAIGMPCVTAARDTVARLMEVVEREPSTILEISLAEMRVTAPGAQFPVTLPAEARKSFLSGHWDATGLLLDAPEAIARRAESLPYIAGF
jgi:3-isopropylmalate/(R)-2-methylmalate dehydratase small subunit